MIVPGTALLYSILKGISLKLKRDILRGQIRKGLCQRIHPNKVFTMILSRMNESSTLVLPAILCSRTASWDSPFLRLLKGINVGYCRVPVGDWRMWINIVCLKGTKPSHWRRLLLLSREKRKSIRNRTSCPKVSYFLTINSLHMGNLLFNSI